MHIVCIFLFCQGITGHFGPFLFIFEIFFGGFGSLIGALNRNTESEEWGLLEQVFFRTVRPFWRPWRFEK